MKKFEVNIFEYGVVLVMYFVWLIVVLVDSFFILLLLFIVKYIEIIIYYDK